jgi:hypothetical protein
MRVIEYRQEHLKDLIDGDLSSGTGKQIFVKQYAGSLERPGWSFTVLDHGHLVACVGITEMWEGVGEAWFLGSARINLKARSFARLARSGIYENTAKALGLWRVQAACRADWPEALRFAKFMGFKDEGLMKRYGQNGEDFIRMAWFNGT